MQYPLNRDGRLNDGSPVFVLVTLDLESNGPRSRKWKVRNGKKWKKKWKFVNISRTVGNRSAIPSAIPTKLSTAD